MYNARTNLHYFTREGVRKVDNDPFMKTLIAASFAGIFAIAGMAVYAFVFLN